MKRGELMKELGRVAKANGWAVTTTEGGRHTKVQVGPNTTFVPRHGEINEITAAQILKQAKGLK